MPQILKNVRYAAGKPLDNPKVQSAITDAEKRLNGNGRLLVRSSGTEPVIRVMVEGRDERATRAYAAELAKHEWPVLRKPYRRRELAEQLLKVRQGQAAEEAALPVSWTS